MMKKTNLLIALLSLVFLSTSCDKDDDDEDASQGYQVEFREKSTKSAAAWNINSATVVVSEVELTDDDAEASTDIEGSYEVNLMNGTSDPEMPVVETESGTYSELHFTLGGGDASSSMHIEAEWGDSTGTHSVIIDLNQEMSFQSGSADSEIVIESGSVNDLVVYISVQEALGTLAFAQAVISTDGTIRIGNGENTLLATQFMAALSAELED